MLCNEDKATTMPRNEGEMTKMPHKCNGGDEAAVMPRDGQFSWKIPRT
jgi:hypothetical protein